MTLLFVGQSWLGFCARSLRALAGICLAPVTREVVIDDPRQSGGADIVPFVAAFRVGGELL